jgi:hypothetical protein
MHCLISYVIVECHIEPKQYYLTFNLQQRNLPDGPGLQFPNRGKIPGQQPGFQSLSGRQWFSR